MRKNNGKGRTSDGSTRHEERKEEMKKKITGRKKNQRDARGSRELMKD